MAEPENDVDCFDLDFFNSMADLTKRIRAAKKKMVSHPLYAYGYGYAKDSNLFADSHLNDEQRKTFKEAVDHYLALEAESEAMFKSHWRLKSLNEPNPWIGSSVNDKRRRRDMEQEVSQGIPGSRVNEVEELKEDLELGRESRLEQGGTDMQY